MIKYNEGNVLDIENEKGSLSIEDDISGGISLFVSNENIALKMVALLSNEQIKKFLENEDHIIVQNHMFSESNGRKKIVETIFTTVDNFSETTDGKKRRIVFISEDTTYDYTLTKKEWESMVHLMKWVSNGYKESLDRLKS